MKRTTNNESEYVFKVGDTSHILTTLNIMSKIDLISLKDVKHILMLIRERVLEHSKRKSDNDS
jgi:hypothetical protein